MAWYILVIHTHTRTHTRKLFIFCILYVAEGVLPQPKMHSMQYTVFLTFI